MRKRKMVRSLALLMAVSVLSLSPELPAMAAATKQEQQKIDSAAEQKKKLEAEKSRTQKMLNELNGLKADAAAYVQKIDADLSAVEDEIEDLTGQIGDAEEKLKVTEAELTDAEAAEDEQYQDMKLRIKYMYEKGNTGFLDLLLSAKNLSELLNHAEYVQKISEYDRKELDRYQDTVNAVQEKRSETEQERDRLVALRDDETAKQSSLETLMSEKQKEVERLKSQIGDAATQLNDYDRQIDAQEAEIRAVEAAVKKREEEERKKAEEEAKKKAAAEAAAKKAAQKASLKSIGDIRFRWPCPSSGRITSGFGSRTSPTKGASSSHQGIDISASTGAAIVAAADGEVVTATYSSSAGNYVMISHGGGVYTVYMHCSKLNCSVGQKVKAGATIAKVGSTGVSTGPHLHFGIRSGGAYVNPSKYVMP